MGRDGSELRGQHGDSIQHVLLWAHSSIPHTGNCNVALEGLVPLGLGAVLEFLQGLVSFFLQIHLGEHPLHVTGIMQALLGAFSSDYSLELPVLHIKESCKRLLHNRIGQGAVQLDISPLVSLGTENVSTKEASINGPEGFMLIGVCGFEFPGTGEFINVLIGEGKDSDALIVPLYLHT